MRVDADHFEKVRQSIRSSMALHAKFIQRSENHPP
jgi:hypothetical protein